MSCSEFSVVHEMNSTVPYKVAIIEYIYIVVSKYNYGNIFIEMGKKRAYIVYV